VYNKRRRHGSALQTLRAVSTDEDMSSNPSRLAIAACAPSTCATDLLVYRCADKPDHRAMASPEKGERLLYCGAFKLWFVFKLPRQFVDMTSTSRLPSLPRA